MEVVLWRNPEIRCIVSAVHLFLRKKSPTRHNRMRECVWFVQLPEFSDKLCHKKEFFVGHAGRTAVAVGKNIPFPFHGSQQIHHAFFKLIKGTVLEKRRLDTADHRNVFRQKCRCICKFNVSRRRRRDRFQNINLGFRVSVSCSSLPKVAVIL